MCTLKIELLDGQDMLIILASNLLFGSELNARLRRRLEDAPSVRAVAALARWPEGLDGFAEPEEVHFFRVTLVC